MPKHPITTHTWTTAFPQHKPLRLPPPTQALCNIHAAITMRFATKASKAPCNCEAQKHAKHIEPALTLPTTPSPAPATHTHTVGTHLLRNILSNYWCGMHRTCTNNPLKSDRRKWLIHREIQFEVCFLRPCSEEGSDIAEPVVNSQKSPDCANSAENWNLQMDDMEVLGLSLFPQRKLKKHCWQVRQRDVSLWYHCDIWPSSLAQEPESHLCPLQT